MLWPDLLIINATDCTKKYRVKTDLIISRIDSDGRQSTAIGAHELTQQEQLYMYVPVLFLSDDNINTLRYEFTFIIDSNIYSTFMLRRLLIRYSSVEFLVCDVRNFPAK